MLLKDGRELVIEKARPEDGEALVAYLNRVGGESDNLTFGQDGFSKTPEEEAQFVRAFNARPDAALLVGRLEGHIVSVAHVARSSAKPRLAHMGDMSLSVARAFWNLGAGTAMTRHCLHLAQAFGLSALELQVRSDNAAAIRVYEKCGFFRTGTTPMAMKIHGHYWPVDSMLAILPPQEDA